MHAVVVSDLHIGSRSFIVEPLINFLGNLPEKVELVLNGDTVDRRWRRMGPVHQEALNLILKEADNRRVVWIWGNHDWKFRPPHSERIKFVKDYNIGKRLFLSHGYNFDYLTPLNRPILTFIRMVHDWSLDLGAKQHRHVAFSAKKFARLYRVLRMHIAKNAVRFARRNGYQAVTCGHTHYAEDIMADGIRYINTGSWTEAPIYYLSVNSEVIELKDIRSITETKRIL